MKKVQITVSLDESDKRVDLFASNRSGLTRSQVQRCITKGLLTVNKKTVKANYKIKPGDIVDITVPDKHQTLVPEDLSLHILYCDDAVMVVNKPPGMVVYPSPGHEAGTLMNAIAHATRKTASVGAPLRPGVVHRLDKDTSGVMVVALDDKAYYDLVIQFRERAVQREYKALIFGRIKGDKGTISLPIGRAPSDRKKMSARVKKGRDALTNWKVIERFSEATLIAVRLGTGRTHQIRVHFASLGYPVLGDQTYGKKRALEIKKKKILFPRQMLHAEILGFSHPMSGEYMEFRATIPSDMKNCLEDLRSSR
ncbi:MAG: RluA family pseudouridine synthase [Nitrospiraceae bacterium]|nr:MAG: RluA family pseudouridine synthase [Nitrospiraceae bacterium]